MEKDELFEAEVQAWLESQKSIYHMSVDLGIGKFKKHLKDMKVPRKIANKIVARYKKRAWMEFSGITRGRGTSPYYHTDAKKIKVDYTESEHKVICKTV